MENSAIINGLEDEEVYNLYAENTYTTNLYINGSHLGSDLNDIIAKNTQQDASINDIIAVNTRQDASLNNINNNALYNLSVSSTTLDENQSASVSISKTGNNASLNFGIPRGKRWRFLGDWVDIDEPYNFNIGDCVRYNGKCWFMSVNNYTADVNPQDSNEWLLLVDKGDTGEKGDKGDKGDSGLDDLLTALGVITAGILIPMSLATLLGRINSIPDIENDVGDLNDDVNNQDNRIAELERKTKYQDSLNNINETNFNSDIVIKYTNPTTNITTNTIIMDRETGKITCDTLEPNTINANGNIYTAENLTAVGNATLGSGIINGSRIDLNGFVYVNNFPLSFGTGGFFEQW